ncbi:phosphate ABC transporter permease subunit PstC [Thalassoroseus pseudoceratinae]|uniref:phosphate ABC transporter permease subunit PstC n=1 Tax=Thalassoroseus pseudoceratinae TaxID=2713176 RepID=UPI001424A52D|nr:phosphate ABC transporter permease subunit PstC [Thalassoroseus pseudoceratinae]
MAYEVPLRKAEYQPAILRARQARRWRETGVLTGLVGAAAFSVLTTVAIIGILFAQSVHFFRMPEVTVSEFFFTAKWPVLIGSDDNYGIWPLICGSLLVTLIAMAVALPLGLVTAIYLSEYAPRKLRSVLKPTLEVLAGIPTVVYGFFALTFITPMILQKIDPSFNGFNAASAGIAVGILCLPIVTSLTEDALQSVPRSLREGAYGLGGTKLDVSVRVVLPAALSGLISATLLAFARAMGETMIVALAAGQLPQVTFDPRDQIETMTGFMVRAAKGDIEHTGAAYYSLYAVAGTLFIITFALTVLGQLIRRRFREEYR